MAAVEDRRTPVHSAADENTPLLFTSEAGPTLQPNADLVEGLATAQKGFTDGTDNESPTLSEDDTPLPKFQIFLLCYASLVEPVAYFSIFPFINQMIKDTGDINEEDVGFWSGTIVSTSCAPFLPIGSHMSHRNLCSRSYR